MTNAMVPPPRPEIAKIHRYLDSLDLYLLTQYDWSVIRQGLAAATGLEVSDRVWHRAIESYLASAGRG